MEQNFVSPPVNLWNLNFESVLCELKQVHLRTMKPAGLPPMERRKRIDDLDVRKVQQNGKGKGHDAMYGNSKGMPDVF